MSILPSDFIDVERYPVDQPKSAGFNDMIAMIRSELASDGCAVLKGFVRADKISNLIEEADKVSPYGHHSMNRTNVYFSQDDETLDPAHPRRRFFDRSNSFIPADNFGESSALRAIYEWPLFFDFIRQALDEPADSFFRYADPLADVIVNMAGEGNGFPWHFDTNNFTVTLAIQNADEGGDFEYAPNIRSGGENFEAVRDVLDETSDHVTTLRLEPGDLQIFKGRYSLHRVAPLKGETPRYVAIFSYVEQEGMVGSPERTKQLYGRVLPIHLERAGLRGDEYLD